MTYNVFGGTLNPAQSNPKPKFLLCISSQGQDLYSHQKLNMYIYWFSSESSYRRWQRRRQQHRMPQY